MWHYGYSTSHNAIKIHEHALLNWLKREGYRIILLWASLGFEFVVPDIIL